MKQRVTLHGPIMMKKNKKHLFRKYDVITFSDNSKATVIKPIIIRDKCFLRLIHVDKEETKTYGKEYFMRVFYEEEDGSIEMEDVKDGVLIELLEIYAQSAEEI